MLSFTQWVKEANLSHTSGDTNKVLYFQKIGVSMMSKVKLFVLLILTGILMLDTNAQSQETRVLTYQDAIYIALNQSHTVKVYSEQKRAMEHFYNYRKAMFKPRLDFQTFLPILTENVSAIPRPDGLPVYNSTGFLRYGGDVSFKYILPSGGNLSLDTSLYREDLKTVLASASNLELTTDQAQTSISLNFRHPIFTKNLLRENLEEARYNYETASSQFTRQQMDIIYHVTEAFYTLYRATRELEIAEERQKNSEEAYRIAKLKGETGRIPEGDVLISEIELAQNTSDVFGRKSNLEKSEDAFKHLIGLSLDEDIGIVMELTYDTFEIDLAKAIEEGLKSRLEVEEAELGIKLQEINIDKAKRIREFSGEISAYYDITGVSTTGEGSFGDLFSSSFDNISDRPDNMGVTLLFSYPIFDWGRGASRVLQEKATMRERQLHLDNAKTTIVREIRNIVRSVEEARNKLKIQEKNQELSQRSYQISKLRFENGTITSQELGVEQENLADTQLQYLNAFITHQLATADLKRKTIWNFKENRRYLVADFFRNEEQNK